MTLEITCYNLEILHLVKCNTHRLCIVFVLSVPNVEFLFIKVFVLLDKFCKIYQVVCNPRHKLLRYKRYIYIISKGRSSKICQIKHFYKNVYYVVSFSAKSQKS